MLKKINLHNYGPYVDETIELSPNLTAIIGQSDEGKSTVVRAIEWVRTNRPLGDKFMRRGQKEYSVTIETDSGKVKRFKGKDNGYQINDDEPDTAIKTEVPEQATSILGLKDLNVQRQFGSHYLVFDSGGKVAKQLNEIIHLEKAVDILDGIDTKIRKDRADLKHCDERISELDDKLNVLDDLDNIEKDVEDLKIIGSEKQGVENDLTELTNDFKELKQIEKFDVDFSVVWETINSLYNCVAKYQRKHEKHSELVEDIKELNSIDETLLEMKFSDVIELCDNVLKEHSKFAELNKMFDELKTDIESTETTAHNISKFEEDIGREKTALGKLMESVDVCPVCNQSVDGKYKERVLENYR